MQSNGEPGKARQFLEQAVEHQQAAVRAGGRHPSYQRVLQGCYHNLGGVLALLGETAEAEKALRHAIAVARELPADMHERSWHLAPSLDGLGLELRKAGRAGEAEIAHCEALKLHRALAADFSQVPEYRSNLAR